MLREFNGDRKIDFAIMEAMKLLMLEQAVSLYRRMQRGEDVPVWVFILFARDTSPDPQTLVRNHFNNVGDTGGLEQVRDTLIVADRQIMVAKTTDWKPSVFRGGRHTVAQHVITQCECYMCLIDEENRADSGAVCDYRIDTLTTPSGYTTVN